MNKKYNISVDFNELCLIQQALRHKIEIYDFKITARKEVEDKARINLYKKCLKDLKKLTKEVTEIKNNSGEKIKVVIVKGGK